MKGLKTILLCMCIASVAVSVGCAKKTEAPANQPASEATSNAT